MVESQQVVRLVQPATKTTRLTDASVFLQLVQLLCHLFDVLEMAGVGASEDDEDPDCVFIALLDGLFRVHDVVRLDSDWNESSLDVKVSSKLFKSNLSLRMVRRRLVSDDTEGKQPYHSLSFAIVRISIRLTSPPMTMFGPGSWMFLPWAFILACHRFLSASPPSMMASDDPVHAVPMALEDLPGTFQRSATVKMMGWRKIRIRSSWLAELEVKVRLTHRNTASMYLGAGGIFVLIYQVLVSMGRRCEEIPEPW